MGAREPGVADLIRADMVPFIAQLYGLAAVFSVGSAFLRSVVPAEPLERRMWADVHLEALGWALVGLVLLLIMVIVAIAGGW